MVTRGKQNGLLKKKCKYFIGLLVLNPKNILLEIIYKYK